MSHSGRTLKQRVWNRDRHICQYCGSKVTERTRTIDHVVPKCRGGGNTMENCITACRPCNSDKGSRSASQFWYWWLAS